MLSTQASLTLIVIVLTILLFLLSYWVYIDIKHTKTLLKDDLCITNTLNRINDCYSNILTSMLEHTEFKDEYAEELEKVLKELNTIIYLVSNSRYMSNRGEIGIEESRIKELLFNLEIKLANI